MKGIERLFKGASLTVESHYFLNIIYDDHDHYPYFHLYSKHDQAMLLSTDIQLLVLFLFLSVGK